MATHILTVNEKTFPTHLEYMFIGTGQGNANDDNKKESTDDKKKNTEIGMKADICSIRKNDNVIFYVGKWGFFGVFKVTSSVFYDDGKYLANKLDNKILTFRAFIKPSKFVYQKCVSEWDMLLNIKNIGRSDVKNMQWSWIFKKLKANRGCLTLDDFEAARMKSLLNKNNKNLKFKNYTFDNQKGIIIECKSNRKYNKKKIKKLHLENLITDEHKLRLFFVTNIGNDKYDYILNKVFNLSKKENIILIRNEVKCSFGEQSIDLLLDTDFKRLLLIELKNIYKDEMIPVIEQLKKYLKWIIQYKIDKYKVISPILIFREPKVCGNSKRCKYYMYKNQTDKNKNKFSPWYISIKKELSNANKSFLKMHTKVKSLQVYTFTLDSENKLKNFNKFNYGDSLNEPI